MVLYETTNTNTSFVELSYSTRRLGIMDTKYVDEEILRINKSICRHLDNIDRDKREFVAQDVVTDLRHLVDHVSLKIYAKEINKNLQCDYKYICKARDYIASRAKYKGIHRFYKQLEMVVSHYKPDEESSERLMLKYYDALFSIREMMHNAYGLEILQNLEKFPLDTDPKLQEYYEKIAEEIENHPVLDRCERGARYYIEKIKPFFVNKKRYYEVTFSEIKGKINKTDHLIAFSKIPIMDNYASRMMVIPTEISVLAKKMPISVIIGWEVAIRDCEFKNFSKIIMGARDEFGPSETKSLCEIMTKHRVNLVDLVSLSDNDFKMIKDYIEKRAQITSFFSVLSISRSIIKNHRHGENILRLLLYSMNNELIKAQHSATKNEYFSLYLDKRCIPFDRIPYNFFPVGHTVRFSDLVECIPYDDKKDQLLARHIKNNTEVDGILFM